MNNHKKKYTAQDWLEGHISNNQLSGLFFHKKLPPEEFGKIKDYQKQAFQWAVEMKLHQLKREARGHIERARKKESKDPENWLRLEIRKVERFIKENPELEQAYEESSEWIIQRLITSHNYKRWKNLYKTYKNNSSINVILTMPGHEQGGGVFLKVYLFKNGYLAFLKNAIDKESKKEKSDTKISRVREFADEFIDNLSRDRYQSNRDVINALKKVEPKYKAVGNKQNNPLKADGTPYEIRICTALADIFSIKYPGESIHWTTIRDAYKDAGKSII